MHLHWERSPNTAGDCIIRSLSWMGRVPDEIPQEEGWKLSRSHYYQEGWLSTANLRGVVGVTYTSSLCGDGEPVLASPARTNYNLRGHRAEVTLVRWNEPYQKLASCDTSGIIFVWIKYEGRWSIELINDRNTPVICFSWSHDGRLALICYQDGFVLVGSVAGQRYWSTLVNNITSGVWSPDDQHVYLGTSKGDIYAMDIEGNPIGKVTLRFGVTISDLSWNCERFNMEEQVDPHGGAPTLSSKSAQPPCRADGKPYILAATLKDGDILLLRSYDDVIPQVIKTGFQSCCMDWTNNGNYLAVAGKSQEMAFKSDHSIHYTNVVNFYDDCGNLILKAKIPSHSSPVTAITWGHNDKRLFVATGNQVHVGWISSQIASLQMLSRLKIHNTLANQKNVELLPLPCRMQNLIGMLFTRTIRCCIPIPSDLRGFVLRPQPDSVRLHCTMIRHTEYGLNETVSNTNSNGGDGSHQNSSYTLYLEHLGGFLPLLKGRKVSKIKPEFVIYDPQLTDETNTNWLQFPSGSHLRRLNLSPASNSETETDEDINSPRVRRRRRRRGPLPRYGYIGSDTTDYLNILPEESKLAEVSSNIWGTKFKILGLNQDFVPPNLGQINYKASLLHLQPRQMRIEIIDLKDDPFDFYDEWSGDDLLDDEWQSEEFESFLDYSKIGSDSVTMKDDILTAVTSDINVAPIAPLPSRLSFCIGPRPAAEHLPSTPDPRPSVEESRFRANLDNELSFSNAIVHEMKKLAAETDKLTDCEETDDFGSICRTANASDATNCLAGLSSKCSPTILPPRKLKGESTVLECSGFLVETPVSCKVKIPEGFILPSVSPSKHRRLRVSVSCDNYLNDAKFALSRRDSVGSGSPHSSKGSPLRWATKPEELTMTTSMTAATTPREVVATSNIKGLTENHRSSSVNQLDVIVDILGVPSEVSLQRDVNKRLILLGEKGSERIKKQNQQNPRRNTTKRYKCQKNLSKHPGLDKCGKSKSCDETCKDLSDCSRQVLEVKRKSIYGKECNGRSEAAACTKCQILSTQINDLELNRELFDIPTPVCKTKSAESFEEAIQVIESCDEKNICGSEEITGISTIPKEDLNLDPPKEKPEKSPRSKRRFDTVRNLLEKACQKLLNTKHYWNPHTGEPKLNHKQKEKENLLTNHLEVPREPLTNTSQSSPSSPVLIQKKKNRRNRSFSPVSTFWNSPLLRRRKKMSAESSDDEQQTTDKDLPNGDLGFSIHAKCSEGQSEEEDLVLCNSSPGYHNLEMFQRKKLKQKMKMFASNGLPSQAVASEIRAEENDENLQPPLSPALPRKTRPPYPSPPPAPQRVPNPPSKNKHLNQANNKGGFSPFMGRKGKFFNVFPPTPNSTPFSTPFVKRKNLTSQDENLTKFGSHLPPFNQFQLPDNEGKDSCARVIRRVTKRRRKLVLHNKAPMWNEASQVYQLDFGGRVTQESAKNFQIEYKGKQVMQFGRIDNNAYTLDFQYPFTAVQAFAVALANVTQRLK